MTFARTSEKTVLIFRLRDTTLRISHDRGEARVCRAEGQLSSHVILTCCSASVRRPD